MVCTIESPCKINLHLQIGEKRADSYHSLLSIFAALSLSDTLHFAEMSDEMGASQRSFERSHHFRSDRQKGDCHLSVNWLMPEEFIPCEGIPTEENLVFKAVSLFRQYTGYEQALDIRLDKRIPLGAGLGGGSSNAASALLALNALCRRPLPPAGLSELGAQLGSDVPFFLNTGSSVSLVSGRGEIIKPLQFPWCPKQHPAKQQTLSLVLVVPPFASCTKLAYRALDETRLSQTGSPIPRTENLLCEILLIRGLQGGPETWPFFNDFLPVFLNGGNDEAEKKARVYAFILDELKNLGASFAGLSGAGSACFGVFTIEENAKNAEKSLKNHSFYTKFTNFLALLPKPMVKYS